jgi:hypothetical protein
MSERIEYSPRNMAYKILRKLPSEKLTLQQASAALKKEGVKLPMTSIGRVRADILRERNETPSGQPAKSFVSFDGSHISKVVRTAKEVGGIDNMEKIIDLIRKAREL